MSNVVRRSARGATRFRLADHDAALEFHRGHPRLRRRRAGGGRHLGAQARRRPRRRGRWRRSEASGLEAAAAVPAIPSVLPLPLLGGPEDPAERVEAVCASLERLAAFAPAEHRLPDGDRRGPRPRRGPRDRRRRARDDLGRGGAPRAADRPRAVPARGRRAVDDRLVDPRGGRADPRRRRSARARDPVRRRGTSGTRRRCTTTSSGRSAASPPCTSATTATRRAGGPTARCPETALRDVPRILRALDAAGWDGLYDIEIFSDDGTFGADYPDSFWAAPPAETLARAQAAFEHCWTDSQWSSPRPPPRGGSQ